MKGINKKTDNMRSLSAYLSSERLVKHLPGSSAFTPKNDDSWKDFWIRKSKQPWPKSEDPGDEYVGSHIVDVRTGEIFIYPCLNSQNLSAHGREDESSFCAKEALCVPFSVSNANFKAPEGCEALNGYKYLEHCKEELTLL